MNNLREKLKFGFGFTLFGVVILAVCFGIASTGDWFTRLNSDMQFAILAIGTPTLALLALIMTGWLNKNSIECSDSEDEDRPEPEDPYLPSDGLIGGM